MATVLNMHRYFPVLLFPKHSRLSISTTCAPHSVFDVPADLKVSGSCTQVLYANTRQYYIRGAGISNPSQEDEVGVGVRSYPHLSDE